MANRTLTESELREKIKRIRKDQDIIPVLENALNYKDGHEALFHAAIEEIKELRSVIVDQSIKFTKVGKMYEAI